jgi:hypothetical protein
VILQSATIPVQALNVINDYRSRNGVPIIKFIDTNDTLGKGVGLFTNDDKPYNYFQEVGTHVYKGGFAPQSISYDQVVALLEASETGDDGPKNMRNRLLRSAKQAEAGITPLRRDLLSGILDTMSADQLSKVKLKINHYQKPSGSSKEGDIQMIVAGNDDSLQDYLEKEYEDCFKDANDKIRTLEKAHKAHKDEVERKKAFYKSQSQSSNVTAADKEQYARQELQEDYSFQHELMKHPNLVLPKVNYEDVMDLSSRLQIPDAHVMLYLKYSIIVVGNDTSSQWIAGLVHKCRQIIGTHQAVGVGYNNARIRNLIILDCVPVDNPTLAAQIAGRAGRAGGPCGSIKARKEFFEIAIESHKIGLAFRDYVSGIMDYVLSE